MVIFHLNLECFLQAVLRLLLHLGQCVTMNSPLSQELDSMQYSLREFYSTCHDGNISYGPFMKLTKDIQELSVCGLYYFSFLDPSLLQSVATCCLCQDLEPCLLFRFLEVLNSAYKAGHIQLVDYISFLVILLARYEVFPESSSHAVEKCGKSNSKLFRSITSAVCSCLSQIGDDRLVLKMLERVVIDLISNKLPLENTCSLLRTIIALDSMPTKISEQSISKIGNALPGYLIDIVSSIRAEDRGSSKTIHYCVLPCFLLFYRSEKLVKDVMNVLTSFISGNDLPTFDGQNGHAMMDLSSRIISVIGVLLLMHEDKRIWQTLSCYKEEIESLLQNNSE
ncbi:hypothetical protein OSB04_019503 [Centaurea solstitialis]|uniref:TEX10-like TPR repeats domain-containing protein n=1 Tax=Centaurea solstitialis TaxID=347529 RepID=A0AA38SQG4_9ASTR|nr:hypothetical protein OSB04_019503 [Centaurea solstitialis]